MNPKHADSTVDGQHRSIWLETSAETSYDALDGGTRVDTVVVGGGIVGITTASKLADAGQTVAVVDRDRILAGVTGHTTAKLTSLHGLLYDYLLEQFDEDRARQYADANQRAIDEVESTVEDRGIDCDFERVPAYTYVEDHDRRQAVRDEVEAARRLDLPASYTESTELPYDVAGAVKFEEQAQFHPRNYLLELAGDLVESGSHVFENTRALDVEPGSPCRVSTDRGELVADDVVVATNFPFFDEGLYFARLEPKRSYVLAARLAGETPDSIYYRQSDPYFSVRPHPAGDESLVLFGGQNHKTGHEVSGVDRYRKVEREARTRFDVDSVEYRWSTQDYRSIDSVPFVGKLAPHTKHVYVATGFGGWGLTNGTAAGMVLSDLILGRESPWTGVYEPTRFNASASTRELVKYNTESMRHFFEDRLKGRPSGVRVGLDRGEAKIVDSEEGPVGVYRDERGEVHTVSAVCPHMGCHVEWNDGEESWDCPCHGSRFDYDGRVVHTPAVSDLETFSERELSAIGVGVAQERSAEGDD
ncbi:FAD-dependent oxidoreductase [Halobacterium sp. DL1]|jgi:glycine/D-amino acid oxidase-like deaminating enzyme/nitrite reductase/ring-hydroxylating ferredoxin subunit|nr:FAD-dependent oxidoreductase [Halobacterium sp. DL1]